MENPKGRLEILHVVASKVRDDTNMGKKEVFKFEADYVTWMGLGGMWSES